jgi:integrase
MTTAAATPKLRFHKPSGQYLVALPTTDGKPKYVYLGRDEKAAQLRYDALVVGTVPMAPQPAPTVPTAPRVNLKGTVTVRQAASAMVEYNVSQHPNRAQRTRLWSNVCLKAIVDRYGDKPISFLETDHLEELQRDLAKTLANKTVNDYVGMVKRMVKYAAFKKWRAPMETSFLRPMAKPAPRPKHYSLETLQEMFSKARDKKYRGGYDQKRGTVYAAIRLQLLTAARPSEMVTLVSGDYEIVEPGAYLLGKSKTENSSSYPRHLVLCKEAEELLKLCAGAWKSPMAYLFAVKRATKRVPHNLRHTGAFFLHRMDERASREQTDVFLGHYERCASRVSLTYNPIRWDEYVGIAERYAKHLAKLMPEHFGKGNG